MTTLNLPPLTDKPRRAERTPAAYDARQKFVNELLDFGDSPEAMAAAMITIWQSGGPKVRADRCPTMAMLDISTEKRIEMVADTISQILNNDSGTYWRGVAHTGDNAIAYISWELRTRYGR